MIGFGIMWAAAHSFWTISLVGIAIALFIYRQYAVQIVVRALGGKWPSLLIRNFSQTRQYSKALFFSLGCIALFIALLRPQWGKDEQLIKQKGRDVLIALDISKSMLAQDCDPNRLENAKKKIRGLLNLLESERVGLLLFSGTAFVQCPLTTDYSAFHMFLDHVDAETISSGSTAIDAAVQEAIKLFSHTPKGNNKLLLICTDGEDFSSNLSAVKKEAEKEGVRIFTMGFGTPEGAPIPLYDVHGNPSGHQKDRKGKVVISQRNDEILQSLAQGLGGIYVSAVQGSGDIKKIVSTVQQIEKGYFEDKKVHQLYDRYPWFLFAALCAFLIEWIL